MSWEKRNAEVGIEVAIAHSDSDVMAARRFQASRYLAVGHVDSLNSDGTIDDEFVEASTYNVARDREGRIVGVSRFIRRTELGLPVLNNFDLDDGWAERLSADGVEPYEVSALATDPSHDHYQIAALLYRQSIRLLEGEPQRVHVLAVMDRKLFAVLRRVMKFPFEKIGPERHYMGDLTFPTYGYMPDALQSVVDLREDTARFFADRDDLDEIGQLIIDLRTGAPAIDPTR